MARALRAARGFALHVAAPCGALLVALVLPATCTSAAAAEQPGGHRFAAPVAEAAQRFGIPEIWIWRVMHAESRGKARAVSHAGAMGLMQIMPATWASLTARHRLGSDPFEVRANILAGAAYLRAMWDRYRDVRLMLAAYNAGPGRADAYAAGRRGLPAETVAYVRQIAPELGASDTASPVPAPVIGVPGWRDASLFVERGNDKLAEQSASVSARAQAPDEPSLVSRPSARTRSHFLFVPLSGRDE